MTLVEKEILLERRRFAWRIFALSASLILLVLAIAQGLLYFADLHVTASGHGQAPLTSDQAWLIILTTGLLALLAAGWKGYQAWKDSAREIGRLMDEKLTASKNRLEASAEFSHASDPLAVAQRQETTDYLARNPARQRSYLLALAAACCVALLILNGTIATKYIFLHQSSKALAQTKKSDPPKVPVRDPYAKIDIVSPNSDIRATPVEEVVVKAKADSDNGFSAISMKASINGAPEKSIPIDPAPFNKGGEIKFDQSLLIDELGAQPYDVIGYHLEGTSQHQTPLKVSSQIQFIEVRPFREDIRKAPSTSPGANANANDSFGKLQSLVSQQIAISKRTWIIATNQLPPTNPTVVAETGKAGEQQDKIAANTHQAFQAMTAEGLPAAVIDHLSQAETSMHQAVDKIKKPALPEAPPLQQHALGELVQATKDYVRIMAQNSPQPNPSTPQPGAFKDKQKLPPSSDPAKANSMAKLHDLIQREQNVEQNLSPSPSDANKPDDSANQAQKETPKDGQTAQNQSSQDQNSQPPQDSPSSSPGQGGQQTAQNPPQGGQNSASGGRRQGSPQSGQQMAQEQDRIGKDLGDLQNQPDTPASSSPAMSEAQQATQSSANKLAANDAKGALNEARHAEAAMLRAQTVMATEAHQQMRDALAQAQQQLQDASQMERTASSPSDQAQVKDQADAARQNMAQEKDQQAASGDPKLAQLADNLTRQYDQSGIPQKLAQLGNQPNPAPEDRTAAADAMRKFTDQLSAERLAMQTETQNLEDTVKRIDRVQRNMNAARGTPEQQAQLARELQTDLNTALSDANALLPPGAGPAGSGFGRETVYSKMPSRPPSPLAFKPLSGPLADFRLEVEKRLEYLRNQTVLSYLDPDQSPEEYRAQVAAYYERISRETKAVPSNPPAQPPSSSP